MTSKDLVLKLRMMGWKVLGHGFLFPPANFNNSYTLMITGENQVLVDANGDYITIQEAWDYVLKNTNDD